MIGGARALRIERNGAGCSSTTSVFSRGTETSVPNKEPSEATTIGARSEAGAEAAGGGETGAGDQRAEWAAGADQNEPGIIEVTSNTPMQKSRKIRRGFVT